MVADPSQAPAPDAPAPTGALAAAQGLGSPGMPPCPSCGLIHHSPTNYCGGCGTDLRGLGGDTDTLVGAHLEVLIDGRYKIQSKLGEGGMGTVYRVEHTRMGKICALKLLHPSLVSGPQGKDIRDRFKQEARIVSKLVHVNTIQVFDFGTTPEGALYLVMEFVRGRALAEHLRETPRFDEARCVRIAIQVLRSLAEAHENGIVHRDIKPANVMVVDLRDRKDFVKVLDFGIAKLGGESGGGTRDGEIVGTPYYLSPEQARGDPLDGRSDLYSLAAMLFEMLCGQVPFSAPTPLAVMTAHLTQPVPKVREVPGASGVSPQMAAILERAMQKKAADRFPDADAMRAALEELAGRISGFSQELELLPAHPAETGTQLADRGDFDKFAKRLILTRFLRALIPAVLIAGLGGALYARFLQTPPALQTEQEPNNDPHHANLLTLKRFPSYDALAKALEAKDPQGRPTFHALSATLGKRQSLTQGDADFYRFELSADPKDKGGSPGAGVTAQDPASTGLARGPRRTLYASVEGLPNIDLVLELLGERADAPGKLSVLARSDQKGVAHRELLPNLELGAGRFYLQVRQLQVGDALGVVPLPIENVSDDYQLVAVLLPPGQSQEAEPNDSPGEAAQLEPGVTKTGLVGVAQAEDWWRLEPAEPASQLHIQAPRDASLLAELRPLKDPTRLRKHARAPRRVAAGATLLLPLKSGQPVYLRLRTEHSERPSARYSLTLPQQPAVVPAREAASR